MSGQPAIEPVTDEDTRVAMQSYFINMKHILEQDRRRVAERRVGRQSDYNPTSPSHEAANAELARIASVIDDAREIERLRAENTHLRTLVAVQATPCVYCGLTEMAKCASGFPGCARADDLICGEDEAFKAVVAERNTLRAEVARLTAALNGKENSDA